MPTFRFDGRPVRFEPGDTIASAAWRAGVRVFTRSFKHHRPRGLYCLSGDCPNCFVNVDGQPGVRACVTPAHECEVRREGGVPSTGFDLLRVLDHLHALMPVGFYYKTFIRPRWAWPLAQRVVERATGLGALAPDPPATENRVDRATPDVLVIGAGLAGLTAAAEAAEAGASVVVCDERGLGDAVADPEVLERVRRLAERVVASGVDVRERSTAVGIYEGPLVPVVGEATLTMVHPGRVVVATGATDRHEVFEGNDLPGVWQGRAAARLVTRHGTRPGARAVVLAGGPEAAWVATTLASAGVEIAAIVVDGEDQREAFEAWPVIVGRIQRAVGRSAVRGVRVRTETGVERLACDTLVLARALVSRDVLLRMAPAGSTVQGVGDVVRPGAPSPICDTGVVCLCEDVSVADLHRATAEGFGHPELLKRYTTVSMGPCQGVQCGRYLASMAATGEPSAPASRTTARPPARPVALRQLAGPVPEVIHRRTGLHDTHLAAGASVGPSGAWIRPFHYGDALAEYRAVRERVSIMDVSTLGRFTIAGPDAAGFVDHIVPGRVADLAPGRARYVLLLDDAGYVADDGMLLASASGAFTLTSTSGGAGRLGSWLEFVAERRDADVHIVDLTEANGAIVLAGPRARDLLRTLTDDDVSSEAFPYMAHRDLSVAGLACTAIRVGFVGELSFELHHRRDRSAELWSTLAAAGEPFGLIPHGLDALDVLRLEKGHVYIGQDTLPDDTPDKIGLGRMVDMSKPDFIGRAGLVRMGELARERSLAGLTFAAGPTPDDLAGQPIWGGDRIVGRVTSCERSPALGSTIGLGWLLGADGEAGGELRAGGVAVHRVPTPFIDPEGSRVRA